MKANLNNELIISMSLKKKIKSSEKNIINFNQSKENFSMSQGKFSKEFSPNKSLNNNHVSSQKILNFSIGKNEFQKKSDHLNKLSANKKSMNNLKLSENFKFSNSISKEQLINNSNLIRTASNLNKQSNNSISASNPIKKNSDYHLVIKNNNNNLNLFNNNLSNNNIFEKASFLQNHKDQISKTPSTKLLELVSQKTDRNANSKKDQNKQKSVSKNNNFMIEEIKKSEFPSLYQNNFSTQEERDLKKWFNDKIKIRLNQDDHQKTERVTLNKNFSKGNLMSSKLYEKNPSNSLNRNNSSSKINSGFTHNINSSSFGDLDKRESSNPLLENESNKITKLATNKKITIDDRKTNTENKIQNQETNLYKVNDFKNQLKNEVKMQSNSEVNNVSNIIKLYSVKSRAGMTYDGIRKTNQDNFITNINILNLDEFHIFGVFDGHGLHGHFVSKAVKQFFTDYYNQLELYSNRNKNFTKSSFNEKDIYDRLKENHYEFLKTSFIRCEQDLIKSKFEVNFSGTTSVIALILGSKLIIANAGDSRALMVMKNTTVSNDNEEKDYIPLQLSRDHKPDLEDERHRIISCNGRVDRYTENGIKSGPYRVWLRNENFPGLAMSRSIGDFVAGSVGCICEPEINEYEITNESRFIVIASDGVWEFLSNKRVMDIVSPYYRSNNPTAAVDHIIEESTKCWKKEDEVIDDITAIVIFLNKL